jgi:hypothetical protein
MFIATTLLYPCVLVALCLGAGLLVDRCSGSFLAAPLVLIVGAVGLIAVSQLTTLSHWLAPATPYVMVAVALAGFGLGRERAMGLLGRMRRRPLPVAMSVLAYLIALAPVLAAGRTSFSSYMALADSAVHMLGADYLIRHGQHYTNLDLRNSYGQFVNDYYNTSYPSGADTLFGGSSFLLRLPLIWAFQPFNAFMLSSAVGPAWLLARRMGLQGTWAALAALTAVTPALVYAYELFGSVKEITALPMILALGCLVATHREWLSGPPRRALPFALLLAGGVSALGVAFGAWALVAAAVPGTVLAADMLVRRAPARRTLTLVLAAALTLLVAAWPTWDQLGGSLKVAQDIASTSNPGNLSSPLRAIQVFGVWLGGSYKLAPKGAALAATHGLVALALIAAVLGAAHLLRRRAYALAGWLALTLLAWLLVTESATTWASAKTLMLTSPAVVLLAWGGVAALRSLGPPVIAISSAALLALALTGGALASDAMQYHASNLAPTARYDELATIDSRFAGQGPTLFTDFDEWSLYELRHMDVGGPDFVYPPSTLAVAAVGYGDPVDLDRIDPAALRAYPLILTRRDPAASRPPSAYRLVWQGSYYQVWRRSPHVAPALAHVALAGAPGAQCQRIEHVAGAFAHHARRLIAAEPPQLVTVSLAHAAHPPGWGHERHGLVMKRPGRLYAAFTVPTSGLWDVWVQGQIMPTVELTVDGRQIASVGGQLDGNSLVTSPGPPIPVRLSSGAHRLTLTRPGLNLAPGDGGSAVLHAILLTPAATPSAGVLRAVPLPAWRTLCGRSYEWIEPVGP